MSSAMGERTEQDRQAAGYTINARIEALVCELGDISWPAAAAIIGDGYPWKSPMVWDARRAVPGPWTWLSAQPVEHRAAA